MRLFLGGYAQGKTEYVTGLFPDAIVFDEDNFSDIFKEKRNGAIILNHFHLCVRKLMESDVALDDIKNTIREIVDANKDIIIISDEIGNGIVPISEFEREYRELTGRLLIDIAKKSESVERIICQIAVKIK